MKSDNKIVIKGSVEKVFDLITQVRFWPEWHLATRAVSGVTERPFRPGDVFYEFVRTNNGPREIEWHVAEYDRPRSASIQLKDSSLKITYTFEQTAEGTVFGRTLTKDKEVGIELGKDNAEALRIETQSVENLVRLVERIIECENVGPSYP
ncbi:SRPBCC family protein [Limnobaculum parvum]|nr:SRPBCC family protein [Limnobaculum parvum]